VSVDPGKIGRRWEGEARPGHFAGVATVVVKLLNTVRPDLAFFGEKDYQQLQVVRAVTSELELAVGIVGCPTVRDADGLALSSRNAYLDVAQREAAASLSASLGSAEQALAWGERDARVLEAAMNSVLSDAGVTDVDYAAVVDPATLEPVETVTAPARALVAARVGRTRLIDNCELRPVDE
jgi:pantoate--beta-alanine ligase